MTLLTDDKEKRQPSTILPGELWGMTTYFNPAGYSNKLTNLRLFCQGVRSQGLKLMIVELAFGENLYVIPDDVSDCVVRLRTDSVMWQKERLLNVGLARLPEACDKIAWLDADILFENHNWVKETSALLESHPVVQPFSTAIWLPPGISSAPPADIASLQTMPAMAYVMSQKTNDSVAPSNYFKNGHTGFAWTARRSLFQIRGFYDSLILGGADFFMAHAFFGSPQVVRGRDWSLLLLSLEQRKHLLAWVRHFYEETRGSVTYTPGSVLHLWHGSAASRDYLERFDILREEEFDPTTDISTAVHGCWSWATDKPSLHRRVRDYFHRRREEETG